LLVDCWQHSDCCYVKDDAFVPLVVSMEGNECYKF